MTERGETSQLHQGSADRFDSECKVMYCMPALHVDGAGTYRRCGMYLRIPERSKLCSHVRCAAGIHNRPARFRFKIMNMLSYISAASGRPTSAQMDAHGYWWRKGILVDMTSWNVDQVL